MASILDKYGIKEVCDVTFYELDSNGKPTNPVLYLDTLKVSTMEQTAESTDHRGGKGNAILISWDFNKEINVTLTDALFSPKSMAIMFGNGKVKTVKKGTKGALIMKTEEFVATGTALPTKGDGQKYSDASGWSATYEGPDGMVYEKLNPKFYDAEGKVVSNFEVGQRYFCSFDLAIADSYIIDISANSFPGSYFVTGDTYIRSQESGKDEFFQLVFPKAKITSENTLTMEAEGDASTFDMNLKILRPADGKMVRLIKYSLDGGTEAGEETVELVHNHILNVNNLDALNQDG